MAYKEKADAIKYNNAYNSKAYDRINVTVPKGRREVIKEYATAAGLSVNAYIVESVESRMKSDEERKRVNQENAQT